MFGVRLIIDCGANVGYSSAYFLSRFPYCQVIAVEADPDNFVILRRNLDRYEDRVRLIHVGVWSQKVGLVLSRLRGWARLLTLRVLRPSIYQCGQQPRTPVYAGTSDREAPWIGAFYDATGCK
jgi:hypothetical protein